MSRKHLLFFYSGNNPYRIGRLKEATEKLELSYKFIDLDLILFDNKFISRPSFMKEGSENVGYFLGYSEISKYVMKALGDKILFPQKKSWVLADKFNSHIFLEQIGIATPPSALILSGDSIDKTAEAIGGFPCIIKKTTGGNGNLVEMVKSEKECLEFILAVRDKITADKIFPRAFCFLLQKPIEESYGTDFRALYLGKELLGIMKRTAGNKESFKANFSLGGSVQMVDNIPEIAKAGQEIMDKSGLFMAGIDFIQGKDGYQVLEINTSPQFKGFEQATKINVAKRIVENLLNAKK